MIGRTSKYVLKAAILAAMLGGAGAGNAGTAAVTPALAACSKALIESLVKTETLPAYTVKPPSAFVSDLVDKNAFTVIATNRKTNATLAMASCKATPAGEIVTFKSIPLKS
jgi:hypothetical protein